MSHDSPFAHLLFYHNLLTMFFSFLGISIISDIFMCAIEKITSKTKELHVAGGEGGEQDVIQIPVWNNTVANLTLMALGECLSTCEVQLLLE